MPLPNSLAALQALKRPPLPDDALVLRSLQEQRQGELEDRISADKYATGAAPLADQTPSYVQGSPGLRQTGAATALAAGNTGRDTSLLDFLNKDMASNPDTGDAAQAKLKSTQDQLDSATMFDNPQMAGMRKEQNTEKVAELSAPNQATAAGNIAVERLKGSEADKARQEQYNHEDALYKMMGIGQDGQSGGASTGGVGGGFQPAIDAHGNVSFSHPAPKPLGQLEQRAVTSFKEAQPILDDLERLLKPDQNQFSSWMSNVGHAGLYKAGIATDPADQAKTQLAGLLGVLGSSPYVVGSRSFQMIKLAMQHLTNPYQSDKFMQQQINEIRSLWPRMQEEVLAAHSTPDSPLNQGAPSADVWAAPPTPAELGR